MSKSIKQLVDEKRIEIQSGLGDITGDIYHDNPEIQEILTKALTEIAKETADRFMLEQKGAGSIIQLAVNDQCTTEGKLHYQREYGKRDGYNTAVEQLKAIRKEMEI